MALDRWIALVFIVFCCAYGYLAFFTMDASLPPFMQRNPVWPSTFPKILSVMGAVVGLVVLLGLEKPNKDAEPSATEINYRRLHEYKLGQAVMLLSLMVIYALSLRPVGFLMSTTVFLVMSSAILGERKWHIMILVSVLATGFVWYLVQQVLGIFLRPFPFFMGV
ncbi:tripartite tricarboxylate transporter TctB family protein [Ponticoccus sp. SC2-23]|uniref:tripartite tricarboxylate transporter TctB family protein n=1 Tax=Alexandriicola marinus TaxID=2081710 RepID=UPI000FD84567|nr:tripartite tricarboxylate transporter TctB family protein [Alexandriicola marinus]MBM1222596.1 tripartite tricarboxylate transporter TctB family protein [Ponticoccus sp. SC6-9]MBM1227101.1 tripartite tricarboxylate transporter TctB family protein [Ponticoccus sp. SC6-15]MBM1231522.1 tripartite tricarboxylate transporter TctB family protein [Ponticoccus sp. SC6-38]MBM1236042.1 tripartite tricarboxylate transporter TctB family protein [Ponticoccus sp. SC6-45]MBM1240545.1 tripartite tricarboxy